MHNKWYACGLLAVVCAATPCFGQISNSGQASGFFTGVNPRKINFQTVDVSRAMQPRNTASAFRSPRPLGSFNLSRFFRRLTLASWPPRLPFAPILSRDQNPFQPNPIRGRNPFDPPPTK